MYVRDTVAAAVTAGAVAASPRFAFAIESERKLDTSYPDGGYEGCSEKTDCKQCTSELQRCLCEGGDEASDEEELFDGPPQPSWGDIIERCMALAHARGALLADPSGALVAVRGEWPDPGPDAIASRLVAMTVRVPKRRSRLYSSEQSGRTPRR